MKTFIDFLAEQLQLAPLTKRSWPPLRKGGLDYARTTILTALNDFDGGIKRVIATDNGETVGAASYYIEADTLTIDRLGSLSKGVGTALMQHIIGVAKANKKVKRIQLWSSEMADSFYDRFGFKDTDEGDGHKILILST